MANSWSQIFFKLFVTMSTAIFEGKATRHKELDWKWTIRLAQALPPASWKQMMPCRQPPREINTLWNTNETHKHLPYLSLPRWMIHTCSRESLPLIQFLCSWEECFTAIPAIASLRLAHDDFGMRSHSKQTTMVRHPVIQRRCFKYYPDTILRLSPSWGGIDLAPVLANGHGANAMISTVSFFLFIPWFVPIIVLLT